MYVQPEVKVDSSYYCDVILNQGLLPDIQKWSGNNFTFQQDDAPAQCWRQTVAFFAVSCARICGTRKWPPNNPDLNLVDYSIRRALQQLVYCRSGIRDVKLLKEVLRMDSYSVFQKSDVKIEITITATNLVRIKYPLSSFNYHLSGANITNLNKIHCIVFEQQLFIKWNSKTEVYNMAKSP